MIRHNVYKVDTQTEEITTFAIDGEHSRLSCSFEDCLEVVIYFLFF